jgi:hypothetical protein
MTVTGAGGVVENNFQLTEVYVETNPGTCGGVILNGTTYTNGVYVPVENHSAYTATAFSCAGHYLDAFTAAGGLTLSGSFLTVNGSGTLLAVSLAGSPTIFVDFVTAPASCGTVVLGGVPYANGAFVTLAPGTVATIQEVPCANYGVVGWSVSGLITIVGGQAYLNGSGAITAIFGALVPILIDTVPADCGATVIGGVPYANGATATLVEGSNYTITAAPCAHYTLSDFESSPYVQIANDSIAPNGPSTITAVFVPIVYTVRTLISGPGCGTVDLAGAPLRNGGSVGLVAGNYTLSATACPTSTFGGFGTTGGLSVVGDQLAVDAGGNLSASFVPVFPTLTLGGSTAAFVGGTALFYASVAVPVASTGYTYIWGFGDGTVNTTVSNTTTHTFERTGTYTVTVEVIDPFHRSANASTTVDVVPASGANYSGVLETASLVAGVAILAIALVWLVGRRRNPPPPRPGAASPPTSAVPDAEPPA